LIVPSRASAVSMHSSEEIHTGDCVLTAAMESVKEKKGPIKPGKKTLEDLQVTDFC